MKQWGFVLLAYGIVWSIIVLYLFALKRRLRKVEIELRKYRSSSPSKSDEET